MVVCLSFCRREISDRAEQPVMVESGHAFQGGKLHRFAVWPGPAMNHLREALAELRRPQAARSLERLAGLGSLVN